MEGGRGGAVVLTPTNNNNIKSVITQLQTKWGELENGFEGWVCKQSLPVEAAAVAAKDALFGAASGVLLGSLPLCKDTYGSTGLIAARNVSVLLGTSGDVSCVMKKIRGKDNLKARMVASFCAGFMFDMVRNFLGSNAADAIIYGAGFSAIAGLLHKVRNSSQPPVVLEGACHDRTRCMLPNLGLQNYEKHLEKHLLTDNTMPLLKERDLEIARIPLGPRVLVVHRIERHDHSSKFPFFYIFEVVNFSYVHFDKIPRDRKMRGG
ncbi:hypothetical protein MKW98_010997 [Papaver atlanticum]|uniref:Uncharacterized protein n=1 Tax=Papaver atlanticum TaxID=357466 RepID=A0AAD4SKI1_9MAGN|nr:hypothetical protein MKW98_032368 [Papaver atlanticum]KAI3910211.1 hypothetical protein MKW98_010997 [Papaver atlanticum]